MVKDGRLTVEVKDQPLHQLLEEIARQARVAFTSEGGAGGKKLVSVKYQDVPLEEALRELLKDHDAFFFYGVEGKAPATLRAIWVYAKGKGAGQAPVPPEVWASTAELQGRLNDPDPKVRAQAVGAVVERKGDQAGDLLMSALSDQDALVRMQALYSALDAGVSLPPELLVTLTADPSPDVRVLALEALAEAPNAGAIAERALNDPSPAVRNKAKELLGWQGGRAPGPRSPAAHPQR